MLTLPGYYQLFCKHPVLLLLDFYFCLVYFTFTDQQYSYAAFEKSSSESWQGLRGDKDQENCMHVTGILVLLAIIGGFNYIKLPLIYMYLIEIQM